MVVVVGGQFLPNIIFFNMGIKKKNWLRKKCGGGAGGLPPPLDSPLFLCYVPE